MVPAKLTTVIEIFLWQRVVSSSQNFWVIGKIWKGTNIWVKSKGILFVQVLDVHILSDELRIFTVADGTFFVHNFHLNEYEWHVTQEVRIVVMDPSELLKKIRVNMTVIYCFSMSFKFTLPWCYQTIYTNIQL